MKKRAIVIFILIACAFFLWGCRQKDISDKSVMKEMMDDFADAVALSCEKEVKDISSIFKERSEEIASLYSEEVKQKYPIPSNEEIRDYLKLTQKELEEMTGSKVENMLSITPVPAIYSKSSYWFICSGWDVNDRPRYLVFYEGCDKEYLKRVGVKSATTFSEIMKIMGDTDIVAITSADMPERIGIWYGEGYYKIEYIYDDLEYAFIADNPSGDGFTMCIGLADYAEN